MNFIARMQGMGGTMMAGGMQQRMAVGGNPGKDTHFFSQVDTESFGENNLSVFYCILCALIVGKKREPKKQLLRQLGCT